MPVGPPTKARGPAVFAVANVGDSVESTNEVGGLHRLQGPEGSRALHRDWRHVTVTMVGHCRNHECTIIRNNV